MGHRLSKLGENQALVPQGARFLPNPVGAAPGIILSDNHRTLILLPGVPGEVKAVTESGLLEYIRQNYRLKTRRTLLIRTAGRPETYLQERLSPFLSLNEDLKVSYLPKHGIVDLRIEASSKSKLGFALTEMKKILGTDIYAIGDKSLAEAVGELLAKRKATLAVAESCTAGLLASAIVDVAGSSRYFLGGVVSYSNESKEAFLDVPYSLISKYGAVSHEVARAMAEGVRRRFGSTYGLSITGVAGPGGGTRDKPVGLVYIGLSNLKKTKVIRTMFPSNRDLIRARSVTVALDMLRRILHHD
jgi:nicotinamide-nucleotide amidase